METINLKDEIISVKHTIGRNERGIEYPIIITTKISRIFINVTQTSVKITFRRTTVFEYTETGNIQNRHSKAMVEFDISHLDIEVFNLLKTKLTEANTVKQALGILEIFNDNVVYGGKGNFEKSKRYINALLRDE
jgi:Na+-transporting NADH:ubiquinone oxidoreductase subunit NqrA